MFRRRCDADRASRCEASTSTSDESGVARSFKARGRRDGSFTVVIPALNEESRVSAAISSAKHPKATIIVVDGGSSDNTVRVARAGGVKVVRCDKGRAKQMNHGAATAGCGGGAKDDDDILVFLHADSTLPVDYYDLVMRELNNPLGRRSKDWGAFKFKMSADQSGGLGLRALLRCAIEFGTNARSKVFGMPYGDQALVVRKKTFEKVGGFDELPFMEDYVMAQKLQKHGAPTIFEGEVTTSARRWDNRGFAKVTLVNQLIVLGYHCGIPLGTLADWYRKV
jgi:rSAM/selenodomain-associated transferase 2